MRYFDELKRSMEWLAMQDSTYFIGQAVCCEGTAMYNTLKDVDVIKRLELPVAEVMQMGMTTGLSLNGFVPVSIFPRWNFLLLAADGIINHLDKLFAMSCGEFKPKAIIRTAVGSERPLHPQHQHTGDFTEAFRLMCKNIDIIRLDEVEQIFPSYQHAYMREDGKSTILVEVGDYYNEK